MYQIVCKNEPLSVNSASSERKDGYKKEIENVLKGKYPQLGQESCPYDRSKNCYFLMAYFYKGRLSRDNDNIIKYTQDAFSKLVFKDDRQVKFCLSEAIPCDNGATVLDMTNLEDDVAGDLFSFIQGDYDKEHVSVTYIECGEMNDKFYNIRLEERWK